MVPNYLENRQQIVKVNNDMSSKLPPNVGVPQGPGLGPLLEKVTGLALATVTYLLLQSTCCLREFCGELAGRQHLLCEALNILSHSVVTGLKSVLWIFLKFSEGVENVM